MLMFYTGSDELCVTSAHETHDEHEGPLTTSTKRERDDHDADRMRQSASVGVQPWQEATVRYIGLLLVSVVTIGTVHAGQVREQDRRAQIAAAIERRLQAQQPVDLSADSITLTGRVLRLKGHVHVVWLPDASIRVEEMVIDGNTVRLVGNVSASLGRSSGVPQPSIPGIDYR